MKDDQDRAWPDWHDGGWGRLIIGLLLGALIGGVLIYFTEVKADAATMECSSECPTIMKRHHKAERMWRDHRTGRSNGFNPGKAFVHPKRAKNIIGRKIGNVLQASAQSAAAQAALTDDGPQTIEIPGDCIDWRCAGIREYKRLSDHAGCVDRDPALFPPDKQSCTVQNGGPLSPTHRSRRAPT